MILTCLEVFRTRTLFAERTLTHVLASAFALGTPLLSTWSSNTISKGDLDDFVISLSRFCAGKGDMFRASLHYT